MLLYFRFAPLTIYPQSFKKAVVNLAPNSASLKMAQRGRPKKIIEETPSRSTYLDKISQEVQNNQSKLSLVLGALIILVIGILIFNYFQRSKTDLGPAQTTTIEDQTEPQEDVSPDKLPGKYTVKEGDTLFIIAEKYYQDGSKFEAIAKANNLADVDTIEVGQVLEIPKLEQTTPSPTPSENPEATPPPESSPTTSLPQQDVSQLGKGGGDTTIWGPQITGNTYTVQEGDWLSTIAARAYGDIFAYQKIAQANNISNPDLIFPGQVLNLPR